MNDFSGGIFDIMTPYLIALAMFIHIGLVYRYCLYFVFKDKIFRYLMYISGVFCVHTTF